jgi:hypothetical protein
MKKWFYKNVAWIYVIAMASIITVTLCILHSIVSKETFDTLCALAFCSNFIVIVSTIFVGIWGENKLKEIEKGE